MRLAILTTGGTIDKTYNESDGTLANVGSVLNCILTSLRHPSLDIRHVPVMSKDSLDMTDTDRQAILYAVMAAQSQNDAIILIHGTDTLAETGRHLHSKLEDLAIPVILTGAMRPYDFRDTDAVQNVTEALLAASLLAAGIWVVMHGKALPFPEVVKNRSHMTFVGTSE
ncbi:MAG: asparaginase [Deltaproteobacteria bacterium]|nr:MAG: asparaginase [Deltaproteobacteria bacterium]